jgi:hypothetical protein
MGTSIGLIGNALSVAVAVAAASAAVAALLADRGRS